MAQSKGTGFGIMDLAQTWTLDVLVKSYLSALDCLFWCSSLKTQDTYIDVVGLEFGITANNGELAFVFDGREGKGREGNSSHWWLGILEVQLFLTLSYSEGTTFNEKSPHIHTTSKC